MNNQPHTLFKDSYYSNTKKPKTDNETPYTNTPGKIQSHNSQTLQEWKNQLPELQAQLELSLESARKLVNSLHMDNPTARVNYLLNMLSTNKDKETYSYNIFSIISFIVEGS